MNVSSSELSTSPARPGIWKWMRRLLLACAMVATIIAALITFENLLGNWIWKRFQKKAISQGKHFDSAYYIPASVPDSENFGAIPFFAPLFSYKVRPGVGGLWDSNAMASLVQPPLGAPKVSTGKWRAGTALDLGAWQLHLRNVKQLPRVPEQDSAAKEVLLALSFFDNPISNCALPRVVHFRVSPSIKRRDRTCSRHMPRC